MASTSQELAAAAGKTDNAQGIYRNVKLFIRMYDANPKRFNKLVKECVKA